MARSFEAQPGDAHLAETKLNARLIASLKTVDARITSRGIACVSFVGETYRPECTLDTRGPYVLFSVECKKLHDSSAKRLFKEGLAQAELYLTKSKVVLLLLYDCTTGHQYKKAFGRGNTHVSRFAARARLESRLHILVVAIP